MVGPHSPHSFEFTVREDDHAGHGTERALLIFSVTWTVTLPSAGRFGEKIHWVNVLFLDVLSPKPEFHVKMSYIAL